MTIDEPRPVLLVEDADADSDAIARAFRAVDPQQPLVRVRSAEAASAHLAEATAPQMPAYLLVDLNLPGRSGIGFVEALRRDTRLGAMPAVILTTSANPRDVIAGYAAGASSYVVKPFELAELTTTIDRLHRYWRDVARVPPPEAYGRREAR